MNPSVKLRFGTTAAPRGTLHGAPLGQVLAGSRVTKVGCLNTEEGQVCRRSDDVDDLRQPVATFVSTYNNQRLIQRHGHQTPSATYLASLSSEAA